MNLLAKTAPPSEAAATSAGWHQLAIWDRMLQIRI